MKTIRDYIKNYGNYTFLEKEFNEVDNVILSLISYIDLDGIVPEIGNGSILLKDASEIFYKMNTKKEINSNILSVRGASFLLKDLALTKRYQDLILYNYSYKVTFDMQFGALCIKLPNNRIYVSFEGTDGYISGWQEDFMFACKFPTNAQLEAINYLNKVIGWFSPKIYVGGHSKGGNLAIVSSMFCKPRIRRKIISIYNNDGPGLRKKEFESKQYQKILPKLQMFVPKESFVGMLLRHGDNYIVVDSSNRLFLAHDSLSWVVVEDHFKKVKLSSFSSKIEKGIITWLEKLDDNSREKFIVNLFSILKKAEINDLTEFKKTKLSSIMKILKEAKNMDRETKSMMLTYFKDLMNEVK